MSSLKPIKKFALVLERLLKAFLHLETLKNQLSIQKNLNLIVFFDNLSKNEKITRDSLLFFLENKNLSLEINDLIRKYSRKNDEFLLKSEFLFLITPFNEFKNNQKTNETPQCILKAIFFSEIQIQTKITNNINSICKRFDLKINDLFNFIDKKQNNSIGIQKIENFFKENQINITKEQLFLFFMRLDICRKGFLNLEDFKRNFFYNFNEIKTRRKSAIFLKNNLLNNEYRRKSADFIKKITITKNKLNSLQELLFSQKDKINSNSHSNLLQYLLILLEKEKKCEALREDLALRKDFTLLKGFNFLEKMEKNGIISKKMRFLYQDYSEFCQFFSVKSEIFSPLLHRKNKIEYISLNTIEIIKELLIMGLEENELFIDKKFWIEIKKLDFEGKGFVNFENLEFFLERNSIFLSQKEKRLIFEKLDYSNKNIN